MKVRFPLNDVVVHRVNLTRKVVDPLYSDNYWQMNQNEFAMQVEGVAEFYARDGSYVEYAPADGAGNNEVELYLNGSVYGAILHQRKILPLHGSSFRYNGQTIMVCGDAGAGKSSLTASFCLNGAEFLTDDVTPVLFREGKPYIWALSDRMKLWLDTLDQFGRGHQGLERIYPGTDKFFFPIKNRGIVTSALSLIFLIEIKEVTEVIIDEITGPDKFATVRGEIYRSEYLQGMPDNNTVYFRNIVEICKDVKVLRVERSSGTGITSLKDTIEGILETELCHGS